MLSPRCGSDTNTQATRDYVCASVIITKSRRDFTQFNNNWLPTETASQLT